MEYNDRKRRLKTASGARRCAAPMSSCKRHNGTYQPFCGRSTRPMPGVQHQPPVLAVKFHMPRAAISAPRLQLYQQREWVVSLLHDDDDDDKDGDSSSSSVNSKHSSRTQSGFESAESRRLCSARGGCNLADTRLRAS